MIPGFSFLFLPHISPRSVLLQSTLSHTPHTHDLTSLPLLSPFGVAWALPLSSSTAPQRRSSVWRRPATVADYGGSWRQFGVCGNKNKGQQRTGIGGWSTTMIINIEMPSISSRDDDFAKDRAGSKGRGGASSGSRPERDDDRAWDGEEPDCWRRMDEDEVSSRW
ncbi:hypothetical protein NL676_038905 [Syzygium grande]|nr:hypothetical protein NL676_038905 [Syzygium grande]